ncbi:MAG: GPW/gp25 family protein [Anaerolineae bacterium]
MATFKTDDTRAFLGVGWAFPLAVGADHRLEIAAYEEDIRQAILIIVFTNRGERVMRPEFGAGLRDFLFEPVNATTMNLVRERVKDALITWEQRIDVLEVKVETDIAERSRLFVDLHYRVRITNSVHNLVFPFYLQEGNPDEPR